MTQYFTLISVKNAFGFEYGNIKKVIEIRNTLNIKYEAK